MMPHDKETLNKDSQLIRKGMERLDEGIDIDTPSVEWFEQFIVDQRVNMRRKLYKELGIFLIVALGIISVVLYSLYQRPVMFWTLQGISLFFVIGYCMKSYVKKVDKG
ncbi:YxlC family protein [Bacillaceae bacterium CLA-AA-H227]|uniref:YxlC family protein n=1 Tax=Robertmurraya yapensis (ex Hitch et al 2024) TaxID=3133160 RepID=A0ACC6SI15_9BACI